MQIPKKRALLVAVALSFTVGTTACVQRNIEFIDDEEAAGFPPPPSPRPASERSTNQPTIAATRITGVVEVAPELGGALPDNATLYLIVRVAGRDTGAPLAVQQIPDAVFPFDFVITEKDSMIPGTPLVGEMSITARLDQDGDAFSTSAGDLLGQTAPVVAGATDVVVQLNERVAGAPDE